MSGKDRCSTHQIDKSCNVCKSVSNLKRCNRCKTIYYCSRDHQKVDWKEHKKICTSSNIADQETNNNNQQETKLLLKDNDNNSNDYSSSCNHSNDDDDKNSVVNSVNVNPNENELANSEEEKQREIDSILDFDSFKIETDHTCSSDTKDIFTDLTNSQSIDYMGPSDDAIVSGVEEMLQNAEQVSESSRANDSSRQNKNLEIFGETDFVEHQQVQKNDTNEDYMEFDPRPLRKLKFPLPESYDHKDLAEFISLRLINLGYSVVDEVFSQDDIDGLISEIKHLDTHNELNTGQLGGGNTSGEDDKKSTRVDIRSDRMKWIQGDEEGLPFASKVILVMDSIMQFVSQYLKVKGFGNIQGRSKAMLTCYPGKGTFYRRHIDNPNKDGRRITCILYLNKDWDVEKDGGLLRILPPNQEKQVDIPPKANRLLFFWSDKRNPHEVHPTYRERFAMTVWYFDADERTASKVQKMKEETDSINQKITELEEKRKEMIEAARQQQLQNRAMEAVQALSQEELQAISLLVHTHPQPRQVLTAMGISSQIQDALIQYLTNLL